jgi:2-C-methyl-D-erythritol 4-phosphate cytidylyltransferase
VCAVRTAAILLAGGAGTRLHPSENKVYLPVADRPLLTWSLRTLETSPLIDDIVLVIRAADAGRARRVVDANPSVKLRAPVEGGAIRHASEQAGLDTLAPEIESGDVGLVVIHDAARPFVSHGLLARVVRTAQAVGGAIPGLPLEAGVCTAGEAQRAVPVRHEDLRRVQTPQAFRAAELLAAYRAAAAAGFHGVDTAESVERFSDLEVRVVDGDPRNLKVTFVEDLFTIEELAASWSPTIE